MAEDKKFEELAGWGPFYPKRQTGDGFFYCGPLFMGLAFSGTELFCPACGEKMERNAEFTEWFRCNGCKFSYNVLDKLPADHPVFKLTEDDA